MRRANETIVPILFLLAAVAGCCRYAKPSMTYGQLVTEIKNNNVQRVSFGSTQLLVVLAGAPTSGVGDAATTEFVVAQPPQSPNRDPLEQLLQEHNIQYEYVEELPLVK